MDYAKKVVIDEGPEEIARITNILYRKGLLQRQISDGKVTITSRGEKFIADTER